MPPRFRPGAHRGPGQVRAQRPRLALRRPRPLTTKGPRPLQQALLGPAPAPYPPPPAGWPGSVPEWAIYWAATAYRRLVPDVDFTFQAAFGVLPGVGARGRLVLGGLVVDFVFPAFWVAVEVYGEFYHYTGTTRMAAFDAARRAQLTAFGYQMVVIDGEDALRNPYYYLDQALLGVDLSRSAEG